MKRILLLLLFVLIATFAKAQDYRTDVVVLDSLSKITSYYGGSKLIYVKDTTVGGYFYLYQGNMVADGKDIITGSNSSKWRRVLAANIDYTVLQLPSYSALRSLARVGRDKTYIVYYNGVNNYFRYDPIDDTTPDDTAMTIVGVSGARFKRIVDNNTLDPRWFGVIPDDSNDDWYAAQKCINYAIASNYKRIVFPGGYYKFTNGLLLINPDQTGYPQDINLAIEGHTKGISSQHETYFEFTHRDNFGIAIQRGKGATLKNLYITGTNNLNYSRDTAFKATATYILDSQRNNRYSPYAGLVLDPFGNGTTGSNRYPRFESYYAGVTGTGGSTDCKFENVSINGFVVGIVVSPNASTQNNECHTFDNVWLNNCKYGYVSCNSQERNTYFRNIRAWQSVQTVFSNHIYGNQLGDPPVVQGGNVADNIYQIFDIELSNVQTVSISDFFAESFYRIGTINSRNVQFNNCNFHLAVLDDTNTVKNYKVQNWIYYGTSTQFNNTNILFYKEPREMYPLNFAGTGPFVFNNCYLNNPASVYSNQWASNDPKIIYKECRFYSDKSGATDKYISDNYVYSISDNYKFYYGQIMQDFGRTNVTYSYPDKFSTEYSNAIQYRQINSRFQKLIKIPITSDSVKVTGNTATATASSWANKSLFVGMLVFDTYTNQNGGQHAMRIKSIDGSGNIVFDKVIDRFTSRPIGFDYLFVEDYQTFDQPYLFDYNGSTMTNILKESDTATAGSTLSSSKIYYYKSRAYTVTSPTAGNATNSWAFQYSPIKRGILSNYEYTEYGYTAGNPLTNTFFNVGVLFTEGAIYQNVKTSGADSLVYGYRCTKSGVKGSQLPPEFEVMYKSKLAGSGYQITSNGTNQFKALTAGTGVKLDSTSTTINIKVDTTGLFTNIINSLIPSGTYTPTLYNVSNIDASSISSCVYQKINDVVYVFGEITVDPTNNNTDTRVDISLPISVDITTTYDLAGNGSSDSVAEALRIYGNDGNDRATFRFKASDNASHKFSFAFAYRQGPLN